MSGLEMIYDEDEEIRDVCIPINKLLTGDK